MILIFDLDDTLYSEINFVESGFKEVSKKLARELQISENVIYKDLIYTLDKFGRGKTFDIFLQKHNRLSKKLIADCLTTYRSHTPTIKLYPEALNFLNKYSKTLYLVTDGNKIVQKNKIKALNIELYFNKIYITHQYGKKYAKPSTHCFELIKHREKCNWSDMIYVGDNPNKDFVGLNQVGMHTIRVLTGQYATVRVNRLFGAKYVIPSLKNLKEVMDKIG